MPTINQAMSQKTYKYWSKRLTDAGIVHEVLNDYSDFLEHPKAKADNTGSWLDQPGLVGPAPVPSLAGITPPANVSPKGTSPLLEQHSCNIPMELDSRPRPRTRYQRARFTDRHRLTMGIRITSSLPA